MKHIFVIDDDANIRQLILRYLENKNIFSSYFEPTIINNFFLNSYSVIGHSRNILNIISKKLFLCNFVKLFFDFSKLFFI